MRRAASRLLLAAAAAALAACAVAPLAPAGPSPTRLVSTTRGRIWVDDGGRGGLPVVFLGGPGAEAEAWGPLLAHARRDRRAVALDLPGFGRSDPPRDGDWGAAAVGEDVGRVADALGLSRFVLVAHDWAGAVASAYAARHPLRVAGILFVDGFGGTVDRTPAVLAALRAEFAPEALPRTLATRYHPLLEGALPSTRERVTAALAAARPAALLGASLALLANDPVAQLKAFGGPRFALASGRFVLRGVQASIEGLPYRKVAEGSHWLMLDAPGEVKAALDELLAKAK